MRKALTVVRLIVLSVLALLSVGIAGVGIAAPSFGKVVIPRPGPLSRGDAPWLAVLSFKDGVYYGRVFPSSMFEYDEQGQDLMGSLHRPTCYVTWQDLSTPEGKATRQYGIVISAPCLFALATVLGLYPGNVFMRGPLRRWRLGRRHREGLCVNCGYDLTGNTTGTCPECGLSK